MTAVVAGLVSVYVYDVCVCEFVYMVVKERHRQCVQVLHVPTSLTVSAVGTKIKTQDKLVFGG